MSKNADPATIAGFGDEWAAFDQGDLQSAEHQALFDRYFSIFPFDELPPNPEGFDLGCGSGRWAVLVAPRVGLLHCIDPAEKAIEVAKRRLGNQSNVTFDIATVDAMPLAPNSQDFGYSLGVLHHVPDTAAGLRDCVQKLKPGAPMLIYLYYAFDNRPTWFRLLWKASDIQRSIISRMPFAARLGVASAISAGVYWPLARLARLAEKAGVTVQHFPLSDYRHNSFYTMRTDALDRFGTRLEQRFTRPEIHQMMTEAGLTDIVFSGDVPYWVACGRKARP